MGINTKLPAEPHQEQGPRNNVKTSVVLLVLGIGSFANALVLSGTGIILPVIQTEFMTSVTAVQWVSLAYLVTVSSLLLTVGRIGDLIGLRKVYITGAAVFTIGAVLCGVTPSISWLIAFRVLQAAGSAMIFATAPALLTRQFPPEQRGRALGLLLMMTYLGLTVGPSFGGMVTEWWSWRWIFWINAPLGLPLLLLAIRFIPETAAGKGQSFDHRGAGLFVAAIVLGMVGVTGIGRGWADTVLAGWMWLLRSGLVAAGVVFGLMFLRWERKLEREQGYPMLAISLFSNPVLSLSALASLVGYTVEFFISFLLPFYLMGVLGLQPAQAGLLMMVKSVVMVITAPLAGNLSDRTGPRPLTIASMLLFAGAFLIQSRLDGGSPVAWVTSVLILTGISAGLYVSPNNSAILGATPRSMQGVASAILALVRNVGMVLGTAFSGALMNLRPDHMDAGIRLAMIVGLVIAVLGVIVGRIQAPKTPLGPDHDQTPTALGPA